MRRSLLLILIIMTAFMACKKESVPAVVVDADLLAAPVAVARVPKKVEPVVIVETDIAPFIAHFSAINVITERYNGEIAQKGKDAGVLKNEGDAEIQKYLKGAGLKPHEFMKKAAKIIRAWLGLKILRDPAIRDKAFAPAMKFTDQLERMAAETQARNNLKERSEIYLRSLSADERALIEKHYEELSTVLKDIPVE